MKIREYTNWMNGEKSYNFTIQCTEDLVAEEIAECFKYQYPTTKFVIAYSKIEKLHFGLIIGGLKLPKPKRRQKK